VEPSDIRVLKGAGQRRKKPLLKLRTRIHRICLPSKWIRFIYALVLLFVNTSQYFSHKTIMPKYLFAAAFLVALSSEFVAEPARNVVSLGAANIPLLNPMKGSGFLHLGVKYHQRNRTTNSTTAKRQSYDFLRNDISGYSVQSKFGQNAVSWRLLT
jgi:hypothetical protein